MMRVYIADEQYMKLVASRAVLELILEAEDEHGLFLTKHELEPYRKILSHWDKEKKADDVDRQPGEGHGEVSEQESSSSDM